MNAPPASPPVAADRIGVGIGSSVAAIFLFAIVDTTAKWLGQTYAPAQIVFFRHLFGLIPIAVLVWRSGGLSALRTRRPFAHALRGGLLFATVLLFFTALRGMPLAEVIAVSFTAPLFINALSGPLLGEAVGVRRWAAVVAGLVGALVMVRPGTTAFRPEALLVLASAFMFALAVLLTRRLTRSETNVAVVTYTTVIAGLIGLPFTILAWQAPGSSDLGLFAVVDIGGGSGAYLLVVAYRNAPVAVVAPFEYSKLIWGSVFGWMLWREAPEPAVWIGAAIVAVSGAYITRREMLLDRGAREAAAASNTAGE
jgi:drug/metabolite transporter (DMT)-like permease